MFNVLLIVYENYCTHCSYRCTPNKHSCNKRWIIINQLCMWKFFRFFGNKNIGVFFKFSLGGLNNHHNFLIDCFYIDILYEDI